MTRLLPLALLLSACTSTPTINTLALPESALAPRPLPTLEGQSNRAVGVYANECRTALEQSEADKAAIRQAVKP